MSHTLWSGCLRTTTVLHNCDIGSTCSVGLRLMISKFSCVFLFCCAEFTCIFKSDVWFHAPVGLQGPMGRLLCFRRRCKLARPIPIATPLSHATTASHPPWAPAAPRPPHTAFKYKELLLDYVVFACPLGAPMQTKIISAMPLFLQPGISGYDCLGQTRLRQVRSGTLNTSIKLQIK